MYKFLTKLIHEILYELPILITAVVMIYLQELKCMGWFMLGMIIESIITRMLRN